MQFAIIKPEIMNKAILKNADECILTAKPLVRDPFVNAMR